eukprot:CAMPEP_0201475070 /NCGR_PEP_ID=MMETSP0151_2-20130828/549_1 /ASSEMBLY_ACC=CAM_ASM_000257 /TAXON_ID=200890 /ORGANISM="Paramoeba atlantica, Strain 621/1 / CCAP 1560/9" /LENGTH=1195 /DNA_ID=CAMNT_0047855077 /DNA_START=32 /DNA_END=3619 /DNA_ORIENTATION=-
MTIHSPLLILLFFVGSCWSDSQLTVLEDYYADKASAVSLVVTTSGVKTIVKVVDVDPLAFPSMLVEGSGLDDLSISFSLNEDGDKLVAVIRPPGDGDDSDDGDSDDDDKSSGSILRPLWRNVLFLSPFYFLVAGGRGGPAAGTTNRFPQVAVLASLLVFSGAVTADDDVVEITIYLPRDIGLSDLDIEIEVEGGEVTISENIYDAVLQSGDISCEISSDSCDVCCSGFGSCSEDGCSCDDGHGGDGCDHSTLSFDIEPEDLLLGALYSLVLRIYSEDIPEAAYYNVYFDEAATNLITKLYDDGEDIHGDKEEGDLIFSNVAVWFPTSGESFTFYALPFNSEDEQLEPKLSKQVLYWGSTEEESEYPSDDPIDYDAPISEFVDIVSVIAVSSTSAIVSFLPPEMYRGIIEETTYTVLVYIVGGSESPVQTIPFEGSFNQLISVSISELSSENDYEFLVSYVPPTAKRDSPAKEVILEGSLLADAGTIALQSNYVVVNLFDGNLDSMEEEDDFYILTVSDVEVPSLDSGDTVIFTLPFADAIESDEPYMKAIEEVEASVYKCESVELNEFVSGSSLIRASVDSLGGSLYYGNEPTEDENGCLSKMEYDGTTNFGVYQSECVTNDDEKRRDLSASVSCSDSSPDKRRGLFDGVKSFQYASGFRYDCNALIQDGPFSASFSGAPLLQGQLKGTAAITFRDSWSDTKIESSLSAEANYHIEVVYKATAEIAGSDSGEKDIFKKKVKIGIFFIGFLPVYLELKAVSTAKYSAEFSLETEAVIEGVFDGVVNQKSTMVYDPMADDKFTSTYGAPKSKFTFQPKAEATAKLSLGFSFDIETRLGLVISKLVSLGVSIDTKLPLQGEVSAIATTDESPCKQLFKESAPPYVLGFLVDELSAKVTLDTKLFVGDGDLDTILDLEISVYDKTWLIYAIPTAISLDEKSEHKYIAEEDPYEGSTDHYYYSESKWGILSDSSSPNLFPKNKAGTRSSKTSIQGTKLEDYSDVAVFMYPKLAGPYFGRCESAALAPSPPPSSDLFWDFSDSGYNAGGNGGAPRSYDSDTISSVVGPAWSLFTDTLLWSIEDSTNCGGSNSNTQVASATGSFVAESSGKFIINYEGYGERQDTTFDTLTVYFDDDQISFARSPGGGQGCDGVGPVVSNPPTPISVDFDEGEHTILLEGDTEDSLYHVGAYYLCQVILEFD